MKLRPELISIFLLFSCVYDPPQKGKEIFIHNQTNKPVIVMDSLTDDHLKVYDTAIVNNRRYISRLPNYVTEYGVYQKFYSDFEMNNLKSKKRDKVTLYIIDANNLQDTLDQGTYSFRLFDINIDTLRKYDLNQVFITNDTILFEHNYSYVTIKNNDE